MPCQFQVSMVFLGIPWVFRLYSGQMGSRAGQPAHDGNCRADTIAFLGCGFGLGVPLVSGF